VRRSRRSALRGPGIARTAASRRLQHGRQQGRPNPLLLANEVGAWLPDLTPGGGVAAPRLAFARGTAAVAKPPASAACATASAAPARVPARLPALCWISSLGVPSTVWRCESGLTPVPACVRWQVGKPRQSTMALPPPDHVSCLRARRVYERLKQPGYKC
jgi:hypothetical protein